MQREAERTGELKLPEGISEAVRSLGERQRIRSSFGAAAMAPGQGVLQARIGKFAAVNSVVVRASDGSEWTITAKQVGGNPRYTLRSATNQVLNVWHNTDGWDRKNLVGTPQEDAGWTASIQALNADQPDPVSSINADTHGQLAWQWTLTYQFDIQLPHEANPRNVRCHVHYTQAGPGWSKGPGNIWISGIDAHSATTPAWIVTGAPAAPPPAGQRGAGW